MTRFGELPDDDRDDYDDREDHDEDMDDDDDGCFHKSDWSFE